MWGKDANQRTCVTGALMDRYYHMRDVHPDA
jgi:hypothetical protein